MKFNLNMNVLSLSPQPWSYGFRDQLHSITKHKNEIQIFICADLLFFLALGHAGIPFLSADLEALLVVLVALLLASGGGVLAFGDAPVGADNGGGEKGKSEELHNAEETLLFC